MSVGAFRQGSLDRFGNIDTKAGPAGLREHFCDHIVDARFVAHLCAIRFDFCGAFDIALALAKAAPQGASAANRAKSHRGLLLTSFLHIRTQVYQLIQE